MNNKCIKCGGWDVDKITLCEKHSGSNSLLIDGLAAEVSKAETGRALAGEMIATLFVNINRGALPEELREIVENWQKRLRACGG